LYYLLEEVTDYLDFDWDYLDDEYDGLSIDDINHFIKQLSKYAPTKKHSLQYTKLLNAYKKLPIKYDVKKFQYDYDVTDKNFIGALKSGNEICVSGEYIALKCSSVGKAVAKYLKIDLDDY